jgi:hypothetical protein
MDRTEMGFELILHRLSPTGAEGVNGPQES